MLRFNRQTLFSLELKCNISLMDGFISIYSLWHSITEKLPEMMYHRGKGVNLV